MNPFLALQPYYLSVLLLQNESFSSIATLLSVLLLQNESFSSIAALVSPLPKQTLLTKQFLTLFYVPVTKSTIPKEQTPI